MCCMLLINWNDFLAKLEILDGFASFPHQPQKEFWFLSFHYWVGVVRNLNLLNTVSVYRSERDLIVTFASSTGWPMGTRACCYHSYRSLTSAAIALLIIENTGGFALPLETCFEFTVACCWSTLCFVDFYPQSTSYLCVACLPCQNTCNLGSVFQNMALDSHKPFKEKLEVEITRTTIDYWRVQKK